MLRFVAVKQSSQQGGFPGEAGLLRAEREGEGTVTTTARPTSVLSTTTTPPLFSLTCTSSMTKHAQCGRRVGDTPPRPAPAVCVGGSFRKGEEEWLESVSFSSPKHSRFIFLYGRFACHSIFQPSPAFLHTRHDGQEDCSRWCVEGRERGKGARRYSRRINRASLRFLPLDTSLSARPSPTLTPPFPLPPPHRHARGRPRPRRAPHYGPRPPRPRPRRPRRAGRAPVCWDGPPRPRAQRHPHPQHLPGGLGVLGAS